MNTKTVWQEERIDRLAMLTKLSQQINSSLDLDQVLNAMVKAMVEITDSGFSRLFLWDDDLQVLKVRASYSRNISNPPIDTFKPGEGVAGRVFQTGETIIESDLLYQGHERHKNKDWVLVNGVRSFIMKPLFIGEKIIGTMNCVSQEANFYGQEDLDYLDAITAQAGTAILNANLYSEAVRNQIFFLSLLEGNGDAIVIVEKGPGKIIQWNQAASDLYGYTKEEITGKNVDFLIPAGQKAAPRREEVLSTGKSILFESTRRKKDNSAIPVAITLSPVKDDYGQIIAVVGIHRDQTKQKELENVLKLRSEKLEVISQEDGLTKLFNRRTLTEKINHEVQCSRRCGTPFSFLMIDLDHFKQINDTHGHITGDEVLAAAAEVIQKAVRGADISARYGGEEFCVIFPGASISKARVIAERLHQEISEIRVNSPAGAPISITSSMGLTEFRRESDDDSTLIARADQLLYQAKQNGRNFICTD
jgi:diguanylate cyclase (GGDEF)-like protein/PAS domain S-box-containing protein